MSDINNTYIVLIPKVKDRKQMKDFQPISLCSVLYKVVAKTLANKMKRVLDKIISPSQSTFVPGRLISDNTIIGFEYIHFVKNRRSARKRL